MTYILEDFQKAIARLQEVLELEKTPVNRDSAIKRFELCFDLSWKTIKAFAKEQGVECNSPRACFKQAFQLKLIDNMDQWIVLLEDRNLTAHMYSEDYADQVYKRLAEHLRLFEDLLTKIILLCQDPKSSSSRPLRSTAK